MARRTESSQPIKVWISSCPADERWLTFFRTHFDGIGTRQTFVTDRQTVPPGADVSQVLERRINAAATAILLISADYLAAHDVQQLELPILLRRRQEGFILLVPVLVRPSAWRQVPWLAHMVVRPADHQPLSDRADAEATVTRVIEEVLQRAQQQHRKNARKADRTVSAATANDVTANPCAPGDVASIDHLEAMLLRRRRQERNGLDVKTLGREIQLVADHLRARRQPVQGDVIADAELVRPVGHGNFGSVWRSQDLSTDETVATKIFRIDKASEGIMLWRFRRAVETMSTISRLHDVPNTIIRVRAASADRLAFTMDYISNGNLEELATRKWSLEKKLSVFEAVCCAIAYAHEHGVVHGMIKPSRVLITEEEMPRIVGFGLIDEHCYERYSSNDGSWIFSPPELLETSSVDAVNEHTDVYGLGRLLHYLLVERTPHPEHTLGITSTISAGLVTVVNKATEQNMRRRYGSVTKLMADFRSAHQLDNRVGARLSRLFKSLTTKG